MKSQFERRINADAYTSKIIVTDKTSRDAYRSQQDYLTKQFLADAKSYVAERGVPNRYFEKIVTLAWDEGHSSGFSEVLIWLDRLIDIFN